MQRGIITSRSGLVCCVLFLFFTSVNAQTGTSNSTTGTTGSTTGTTVSTTGTTGSTTATTGSTNAITGSTTGISNSTTGTSNSNSTTGVINITGSVTPPDSDSNNGNKLFDKHYMTLICGFLFLLLLEVNTDIYEY